MSKRYAYGREYESCEELVTFRCSRCDRTSSQDGREVEWGLVVECCGQEMHEESRSHTNEFASRWNR